MSIYHCSIKIISRAGGRSAVASAAYRSGEKLYNDETGITHDFTNKSGVIMNEIILPNNAPKRYLEREVLWNEVQQIEKRSDAQFAREIEVAFPNEMTRVEQIECVRNYIKENFVSKGMIADWALHDKNDGNPHAHIMLTMRGIDEHEKWLQKQKTVFANSKDSAGRPIYDPDLPAYNPQDKENTSKYRIPVLDENGIQKTRTRKGKGTEYLWERISIPVNDWNEHFQAEIWRESWAKECNKYLENDHKIDHRSYERQGIDIEPTIHEGVTARMIENEGKQSDRCEINREIKQRNTIRSQLKEVADNLTKLIASKARGIYDRFTELRRYFGNAEYSGRDAGDFGEAAGRYRRAAIGEKESDRALGRINEIKRTVDITDKEIKSTDSFIEATAERLAELRKIKIRKEADRNERLRKLRERRAASEYVRGNADADRKLAKEAVGGNGREIESTRADITDFLGELETQERCSAEKRNDNILERKDRDAQQKRLDLEAERRAEAERIANKTKSRGRDYSR